MASRTWTDNAGTPISADNLNGMETDIAAAKSAADEAVPAAKTYTDTETAKDRDRLGAIEAKQATKAVRLESGKWVWDLAGATHYLFPEIGGGLAVHATPWPVPNPTKPELDW